MTKTRLIAIGKRVYGYTSHSLERVPRFVAVDTAGFKSFMKSKVPNCNLDL